MSKKDTDKKNMPKKEQKIGHKIMEKKAKEKGEKISETKKKTSWQARQQRREEIISDIELLESKTPFIIKPLKMGAPTKFDPKYAGEMLAYFQGVVKGGYYEKFTEEQVAGKNAVIVKVIKKRAKTIPMFEKYALSIGVDDRTLLNWAIAKDKEGKLINLDFFRSYKQCLSIQAMMLKELGMNGSYVSNIVKLLLSAEHGIYEIKEENDNTTKGKELQSINDMNVDNLLNDLIKQN